MNLKDTLQHFKKHYWSDPVWSKVISAGIIAILTTIYLSTKALVQHLSFVQALQQLGSYFKESTPVNNGIITVSVFIFLLLLIQGIFYTINVLRKKRKEKSIEQDSTQELPIVPFHSIAFFSDRLSAAFPGQRGLVWYNDPKTIVDRLLIFLQPPLKFKSDSRSEDSPTPIWWFRDLSSMYIQNFSKLAKTKVLMNISELEIKRMAVNFSSIDYKNFIYLEAKAEQPTELYKADKEEIEKTIEHFGYAWEEYGLFKNITITRAEYDDGAAIINNKVVDARSAELRMRYLSDYNFLIAPHDSPFNSDKFMLISGEYLNNIVTGKANANDFFAVLSTFKKNET